MTINNGMFSSNSNEWETPQDLFDRLDAEFHFNLDPCASRQNKKCPKYFSIKTNGLKKSWVGSVFMNPPYGQAIKHWIKKAYHESLKDSVKVVVCLIPARTDTQYRHDYVMKASEIRLIKGRLSFNNLAPAPFPSAIVIFNGHEGPKFISFKR